MAYSDDNYTDPIDIAARETERQTAHAIQAQKEKAKQKLPHKGRCWYCEEPVKGDLLFCKPSKEDIADNYACLHEYERMHQAKLRNGR